MSTILKALQKVEERRQQEGPPTDDPAPFWGKPAAEPCRRPKRIWFLLLVLAAGFGGLGLWMGLGPFPAPRKSPVSPEMTLPRQAQAPDPKPLPVAPLPEKIQATVDGPAEVHTEVQTELQRDVPPSAIRPQPRAEKVSRKMAKTVVPVSAETAAANPPPAGEQKSPAPRRVAAIAPRFVVSGIAFQDDRSIRFAIVNDRAMGEGEIIQGAVVEEILEDRVRFALSGSTFEVPLSRRNPSR